MKRRFLLFIFQDFLFFQFFYLFFIPIFKVASVSASVQVCKCEFQLKSIKSLCIAHAIILQIPVTTYGLSIVGCYFAQQFNRHISQKDSPKFFL